MKNFYFLFFILFSSHLSAQQLRAVFFNPSGADNGYEYIEVLHTPSTSLSGVTFIAIEGDGSPQAGTIDQAVDLSTYSTGTNGLLLYGGTTALAPAPDAATNTVLVDFSPDIENGTNTYLLVTGFSGTIGTDYDANDDGILDSTPWSSVLSAVSVTDGGATDIQYGASLGGVNLPNTFGAPHGILLSNSTYYAFTSTSAMPGPVDIASAWDAGGTSNASIEADILHLGNTAGPLPIVLKNFGGQILHNEFVELQWTTLAEDNNLGFEVQHSTDAKNFEAIEFVPSLHEPGEQTGQTDYLVKTDAFTSGKNYYRLLQKDHNGSKTFTQVVYLISDISASLNIQAVKPNPVRNEVVLEVSSNSKDRVEFVVMDMSGRVVSRQQNTLQKGFNNIPFNISALSNGRYFIQMQCRGKCDETNVSFIKVD